MNARTCPHCHTTIPGNAPGGFCPACVLRGADESAPDPASGPTLEQVASAFPKLEILRLIGHGGMGYVYQARQPDLDRTVALKILSPSLRSDPAFEERFAREARVLGKLKHPNIVTLYEHGESGGYFYLMMEFVDGVNLRQAMSAGRFTPEQAIAIVPAICDALQSAHAEGIWHRDIKPENILLDRDGRVKIADFGIARILGDPERNFTLTRTGGQLGSVAYMAPEQHEKPHSVDHRADIYSLGVVIYEMLTGELPLGRFPLPSRRAEVNARIDEIVMRTLEKERELRQQSAEEVKTEFTTATSTASDLVVERMADRSPLSAWLAVLATLASILGTWISFEKSPYGDNRTGVSIGVGRPWISTANWPDPGETTRNWGGPWTGTLLLAASVLWVVWLIYKKRSSQPLDGMLVGENGKVSASRFVLYLTASCAFSLCAGFMIYVLRYALGPPISYPSQPLLAIYIACLVVGSIWTVVRAIDAPGRYPLGIDRPKPKLIQTPLEQLEKQATSIQPTIILHAALFALLAAIFVIVLPRFAEMFREMGVPQSSIPRVRTFGTVTGLMFFPVLFGIDVGLCFLVRKFGGRRWLRQWSVTLILVMVAAIAASSGALYLPLKSVIDKTGGSTSAEGREKSASLSSPAAQNPSFGPVVEREVEGAIDFDSEMIADIPSDFTKPDILHENVPNALAWMRLKGFDAVNQPIGSLLCADVKAKAVDTTAWDQFTPEQLVAALAETKDRSRGFINFSKERDPNLPSERTTPTAWIFETREGGKGILQVLESTQNGVRIRSKLVQSAAATRAAKPVFGPVVERSLYFSDNLRTYIDFQSGELSRAQWALTAPPTDEAQKAWLKQSGVDAYAIEPITNKDDQTGAVVRAHPRLSSWSGGCVFALVPHSQSFDDPRAEDMEARLQETAENQALMGGTYWFKTSDGAKGILHLYGINDSPPQVQLRYRLLAADDVAKDVESWSYTLRHLDAAQLDQRMKAKPVDRVTTKVETGVVTLTGPRDPVRQLATMLRVLDQPEVKNPLELPILNMPPDFFTRLAIPGLMSGTEFSDTQFEPAFFETLKQANITAPQLARALSAHVLELEKATFVNTGTPFESISKTPGASTYYDGTIPCADQPDKPLTLRIRRTTQQIGTKPDIAGLAPWLIEEAKLQSKEPIATPNKKGAKIEVTEPPATPAPDAKPDAQAPSKPVSDVILSVEEKTSYTEGTERGENRTISIRADKPGYVHLWTPGGKRFTEALYDHSSYALRPTTGFSSRVSYSLYQSEGPVLAYGIGSPVKDRPTHLVELAKQNLTYASVAKGLHEVRDPTGVCLRNTIYDLAPIGDSALLLAVTDTAEPPPETQYFLHIWQPPLQHAVPPQAAIPFESIAVRIGEMLVTPSGSGKNVGNKVTGQRVGRISQRDGKYHASLQYSAGSTALLNEPMTPEVPIAVTMFSFSSVMWPQFMLLSTKPDMTPFLKEEFFKPATAEEIQQGTTLAQQAKQLAATKGKVWKSATLDMRRKNGVQFQQILVLEFAPFAGNRENPPDASVKVSSTSPTVKEGPITLSVGIGGADFEDVRLTDKDGVRRIKITQAIETVDHPTKKTERILNDYRSMYFGYILTDDTLTLKGFPTDEITWGSIGFIAPTRDIVFKLQP